jgi:hypothetical protein
LTKDDALDRAALDARNCDARPANFFQVVAEIYNDETINFTTEILEDLHEVYSEQHVLRFEDIPGGPITAEECKRRFADSPAKLIKVRIGLVYNCVGRFRWTFNSLNCVGRLRRSL